ncbi:MAG: hypothetical protein IJL91_12055 [Bacteroidales bacterium]|nr:hypothetical protein [Bacteroidales bacterium]
MQLLKQLYKIHSPSGSEKKLRKFIKDWIRRNVPEAEMEQDAIGNLYVRKGICETYPCLVAHMDQVQKTHSHDFQVVEAGDVLFGFSLKNVQLEGLGADDKNGIWIALKCLKKYPIMKCCFFVQEEIGCIGSSKCDMDFFSDCRWVIQCDRKGKGDLIWNIGGWTELCSKEFLEDIGYERFGYKKETGMMTDVEALKNRGLKISVLNVSCCYYRPHTDCEFTRKSELLNTLAFVENIITTCTKVYPHEEDYGHYRGLGKLDDPEDEIWDLMADFLFTFPDATLDDAINQFYGYDQSFVEMAYEDVKSMYF